MLGAVEFVGGDAFGSEVGGEGDDHVGDFLRFGGIDGDVGGEEAVAGINFAGRAAGAGAVGAAEFLADFHAEAVVEDGGEHIETAGPLDVEGVGRGPEEGDEALGNLGLDGVVFGERLGGEGDFAEIGVVGFRGAGREGAEGFGDGGDGGVEVEIADDGDFDGAGGELGREPGADLGEGATVHLGLRRESEAGVTAGEEAEDFEVDGAADGVGEGEIHLLEAFRGLAGGLDAVAGIDDVGGDELELEEKVFAVGAAADREGVAGDAEAGADGLAGEDAAEFVAAVFAEAAGVEGVAGVGGEAGLVFGLGELAVADADVNGDAAGLEIGVFEIQADTVGESDEREIEIGNGATGGDGAGGAEIGVGPGGIGLDGGGRDGDGGGFFVGGGDERGGFGGGELRVAGDGDVAAGGRPGGTEGGETVGGSDFFEGGDVEIADGDDGDQLGAIPGVVEIGEAFARGFFDDGDEADGQALRISFVSGRKEVGGGFGEEALGLRVW